MGLKDGIWASRRDLGPKVEIWASRMKGGTKEKKKEEKITHVCESIGY